MPTEDGRTLTGTIHIDWVDVAEKGDAPKLAWQASAKPNVNDPRVVDVLREVLADFTKDQTEPGEDSD